MTPPSFSPVLKLSRLPSGAPEIFASIQGEGPTRGLPSVFVRLAHCNLRCTWCDTKYTWDWETYDPAAEVVEHPAEAVFDAVERLHHRNVVITGGEPLIQQRAVVPLADRLKAGGHRIEVETNGTILPLVELASAVDQWNVSPKLSNSRNPDWQRLVPEVLSWYSAQPNTVFKFVVAQPEDLREIQRVREDYAIPPSRIVAMAEAQDVGKLAKSSGWLAPACRDAGYKLSPRLQISLWAGDRGR